MTGLWKGAVIVLWHQQGIVLLVGAAVVLGYRDRIVDWCNGEREHRADEASIAGFRRRMEAIGDES